MQKYLPRVNTKQAVTIGVFILLAMLMLNLNSRVKEYRTVSKERVKLQTEVMRLQKTRDLLKTDMAYVTSEAAVDDWARSEGYLVRPGDIRIVPIVPDNATPVPTKMAVPTPYSLEKWQVWYALFFDD